MFYCWRLRAQDGQGRFLHFPVLGFALELHSEITTAKSMELYPCPCRYLRVTAQKPAESDAPAVEPKKSKNSCAAIEISTAYPSASQTAGSATSLNPKPFSSNCGLQTLHKTSTHPTNPETGKNTVGLCRDILVDKRLPRLRGAENELPGVGRPSRCIVLGGGLLRLEFGAIVLHFGHWDLGCWLQSRLLRLCRQVRGTI